MKRIILLLLITVLVCFVMSEHSKHSKKKKHGVHHNGHHTKKTRFGSQTKHHLKKSKRVLNTVEVDLNNRTITGTVRQTVTNNKTYNLFQGIPYAKPPVGELRFEPPQQYEWEGNYDATFQRNICIQTSYPDGFRINGSEDCLYLNVYAPQTNSSFSLSVLVWIYGGGFVYGNGNYETSAPDNFIDQNLIVVTFNYRLGVFGFLSTGDGVVPGNMGLKDQALALSWVQENIAYFGGSPQNVTIMGESAGGASVAYLVQSPVTKGLFQKAIAHSGNSLCPWSLSRTAVQNAKLLALKNGIFSSNTTEIVERLKNVSVNTLLVTSSLSESVYLLRDPLNGLVYAPVIEPPNPTEFFSAKSYEQLSSCNLTSVPMIIGYNSEEMKGADRMLGIFRFYLARYDLRPSRLVPVDMNVNTTRQRNKLGNDIKVTYVGKGGLILTSDGFNNYLSDDQFVRPTTTYAQLYSGCGQNVYEYRFSYTQNATQGVGHAEELQYFFYTKSLKGERNLQFSSEVVKIWSNFIQTGNPTPDEGEFNVTWFPSNKGNDYSYLDIGQQLVNYNQSTNPEKFYLDKWSTWYATYGNRPYDTY